MCPYLDREVVVPFRDKKYFYCKLVEKESTELYGVQERARIDQKILMKLCFQSEEFVCSYCERLKSLKENISF